MLSVRRVTDSVRVRVTLLATFLVAVVLVVGALLLTSAVEDRLVSDRERAAAEAVGATVDQVEQGVPFGAITHQTFDQQAGVGIFDAAGVAVGGEFTLPIKTITLLPEPRPARRPRTDQMIFIQGSHSLDVAYDAAPVAVGRWQLLRRRDGVAGRGSPQRPDAVVRTASRHSTGRARRRIRRLVPCRTRPAARRGDATGGREHLGDHTATTCPRTTQPRRGGSAGAHHELDARTSADIARSRATIPVRCLARVALPACVDARSAGDRHVAERC